MEAVQTANTWRKKGILHISAQGLAFVFLITIAGIHEAGLYHWWYLTAILISAIFVGFAVIVYFGRTDRYPAERYFAVKRLYLDPVFYLAVQWGIYVLYNFMLYLLGNGHRPYMKSSFVQIMIPPMVVLGGGAASFIFRKNTLRYLEYSIWINYFLVLSVNLYSMGIIDFTKGVFSVLSGLSVYNPFEQYAGMNYAIGLLVIFYFKISSHSKKAALKKTIPLLLLSFLNGKRSVYLALLLVFTFQICTCKIGDKRKYSIEKFVSLLMIAAYLVYILFIDNGIFFQIIYSRNLNTMGRVQMWQYLSQYMEFGPRFLGRGFSFCTLSLEKNNVWSFNGNTYGMHGDVLAMYTDLGFWIFIFWMAYNLLAVPGILRKRYGSAVSDMFWSMTIYLFVLYLTERATNIFILQTIYVVLIIQTIYLKEYGQKKAVI